MMTSCDICNGSDTLICVKCQGLGRVRLHADQECPGCQGSGVVDCSDCAAAQVRAASVRAQAEAEASLESSNKEKANFLGNVELFKHLDSEILRKLASRVHLVDLPAGHVIRENEPTDGLYIIKSGIAQVTKPAGGGDLEVREHLLELHKPVAVRVHVL